MDFVTVAQTALEAGSSFNYENGKHHCQAAAEVRGILIPVGQNYNSMQHEYPRTRNCRMMQLFATPATEVEAAGATHFQLD
jgi:hypothetical protein